MKPGGTGLATRQLDRATMGFMRTLDCVYPESLCWSRHLTGDKPSSCYELLAPDLSFGRAGIDAKANKMGQGDLRSGNSIGLCVGSADQCA